MYTKCTTIQTETTPPTLDTIGEKINLLLYTGQLLMENGADTNRIIRDIYRAALYMSIEKDNLHIFITYNTFMVNVTHGNQSFSSFLKARKHTANMTILSAISKLPWLAMEKHYTLEEYRQELERMANIPRHYNNYLTAFFPALACGCFTILFGGSLLAALITTLCALLGFYTRLCFQRWEVNMYISIMAASFVSTISAFFSHLLTNDPTSMIYAMISSNLFMIPGIPLINTVNDLLHNYLSAGISRGVHTILVVGSMTVGIIAAMHFDYVTTFSILTITPSSIYFLQFLAAALGAIGFSILFNTPVRLLPLIGVGGMIAVGVRNYFLVSSGLSLIAASFLGSAAVSLFMSRFAYPMRTTSNVLTIPSIITLIPGVLLYRSIFAIIQINTLDPQSFLQSLQVGLTGAFTVIAIAAGASIPALLAQRYFDKKKRARIRTLLKS